MNITTIAGLVGGFVFIIISCFLAGSVKAFIDVVSIVIVIGGSFASILVSFPFNSLKATLKTLKALFKNNPMGLNALIETFVEYSRTIKRNGKMALDKVKPKDPFIKKGIDHILGNKHPEILERIMNHERDALYELESESQKVLEKFGDYSPAWGMIGTLIGLVVMMLNLDDPSTIGPSMAVALITTFYGAVAANLVFLPLAFKAETKVNEDYTLRGFMIEGIVALSKEESPAMVQDRLNAFVHYDKSKGSNSLKSKTSSKGK